MAESPERRPAHRPEWLARWRLLLVFGMALLGLGLLAGEKLAKPSKDNHFVHLATSWLDGRFEQGSQPPGYCSTELRRQKHCKHHSYDDWAKVTTLRFEDGRVVRAFPCKTDRCKQASRESGLRTWFVLGQGWQDFDSSEVRRATKEVQWYVTFPPGPAMLMLPLVALFGLATLDVLFTVIVGAAIPVVLVSFLDRERGTADGKGVQHLLIGAAWAFGTPACFLAANGRVWFTAQICGALMLALFLANVWRLRRPWVAGLALAFAVACRPTLAATVIVFAYFWWKAGRPWSVLLRFAAPLVVMAAVLMWMNAARFDSPLEFGHRFLDIRWQARIQEHGLFSTRYLGRNLRCLLTLLPQVTSVFPYFKVSIHGAALWFTSPWILAAFWSRDRFAGRGVLWLGVLLVAAAPLLYQNSGQMQFTYRFAVDWLPLVAVSIGLGGGVVRLRVVLPLILWAVALNTYGAWRFSHKPQKLFVAKPPGWPFEAELR